MTSNYARNFTCEAVEHEEMLCEEVETVREFTYLVGRVSAGGRCAAAVTAKTRCGRVMFRDSGELLFGKTFTLMLNDAVYKSYVGPAILYGSEAWCLKESVLEIL